MGPDVQILRAKESHAAELARAMRSCDVAEVHAAGFASVEECLRWGILTSALSLTWTIDGEVAAMLGVREAGAGIGSAWLIAGRLTYRFPILFFRWAKQMVAMLLQRFEWLLFEVDVTPRHARALRLLERLGARPGPSRVVGDVTFRWYFFAGGA